MTALRLEQFAGIAPRYSDRLLQPQQSTIAKNVRLLSGELRGLHEAKTIADFSADSTVVRRAFRIPGNILAPVPFDPADRWIPFKDDEVDFLRTPVQGDSYERYYWTGDSTTYGGAPKYNTRARLLAGEPPFRLGVPRIDTPPLVTPAPGTTDTRYYLYTLATAYGEEGQPSEAGTATGGPGTWVISGLPTSVPNGTERNVTKVYIYRTRPGLSSSEFFRAGEVAIGTTTFNDTLPDDQLTLNPVLESVSWAEPPAALQGLVVHPGGFMLGFVGRDLFMSEAFRPHAWPAEYVYTTQTEIVGLAVYGNSVVICTNSNPYIGDGSSPASMGFNKLDSIDPCVARRSIVTTLAGVFYASVQGLVHVTPSGTQLVTLPLFTRYEWYGRYTPSGIHAAAYGLQYIAFDTPQTGFIFSPGEQLAPLTELDRFTNVFGVQTDSYTGDVYIIRKNRVMLWDPVDTIPYEYQWRSKVFDLPKPVNFGAIRMKYNDLTVKVDEGNIVDYTVFNSLRITKPLNPINLAVINGVRREVMSAWPYAQNKNPVGGSPLFPILGLTSFAPAVILKVWARMDDARMEEVFAFTLEDEDVYRLPGDFMSDVWQFEIISNVNVYSLAIAETAKELMQV